MEARMEEVPKKRRGPSDATDYSSTQAPATREYAEGRQPLPSDERLQPGGPEGAPEDPGIASLKHRDSDRSGER
jgi:hypothetical protein